MHTQFVKKGKEPFKERFTIASLNATTLTTKFIDGKPTRSSKLDALVRFCRERNVDALAVQEHRIRVPDSNGMVLTAKIGDFTFAFTTADPKGNGGVGWLLSPKLADKAKVRSLHHRVITASVKDNNFTTHLVSGHAPHAGHDDQIYEEFAGVIRDFVLALPNNHRFLLALDANAALFRPFRIGNKWAKASGPATDRFVDLLSSIRSVSVSQVRQPRTVFTFQFPNGGRKQLDHIVLPVRWASSARFIRSVDPPLPTGHRALVAVIKWRFSTKKTVQKPLPRWDLLQIPEHRDAYGKAVVEGFDPAVDDWTKLSELLLKEANNLKPPQREPEPGDVLEVLAFLHGDVSALSELSTRVAIRNKRFTYEDPRLDRFSLSSLASRTRFKQFNDEHLAIITEEMNKEFDNYKRLIGPRPLQAYRALNRVTSVKAGKFMAPGATAEEQLSLTREHFRKMGGDKGGVATEAELGFRPVANIADYLGLYRTGEITQAELNLALRDTASGRAPGTDCLPAEAFKVPQVRALVLDVLNKVYRTKQVPTEWYVIKQVPIPKKGDLSILANWRPICLLNTIVKLYDRIMLNRVAPGCEPFMRFSQSGFRRFRSVDEQAASLVHIISTLKRLQDKNYAFVVNFLDFAKAFPSTSWVAIRGALAAFQVPQEIIDAIMVLYDPQQLRAFVATPDFDTDFFPLTTGTMQGDTLAPYLFIVVLDRVLDAAFHQISQIDPEYGILLKNASGTRSRPGLAQEVRLADLDFADDIALLTLATTTAEAVRKAQLMLDTVAEYASRANLFMKPGENKTAIMVFGQCLTDHKADPNAVTITMTDGRDGVRSRVPIVEKYKYLGRILDHANHTAETAIAARIKCAWGAWHSKKEIWKSQHPSRELKEKLLEIFVRPCLLPNCSTWIPTKRQLRRLDTEYTKMRRMALGLPKFQPGSDPPRCTPLREIYRNQRAGQISRAGVVQPDHFDMPSATITQSCLRLFGHVCRTHSIEAPVLSEGQRTPLPPPPLHYLLFWQPTQFGKRKRGGNRRSLADYYLQLLHPDDQSFLINNSEKQQQKRITMNCDSHRTILMGWAKDRKLWKTKVAKAKQIVNEQFFALAQESLP